MAATGYLLDSLEFLSSFSKSDGNYLFYAIF